TPAFPPGPLWLLRSLAGVVGGVRQRSLHWITVESHKPRQNSYNSSRSSRISYHLPINLVKATLNSSINNRNNIDYQQGNQALKCCTERSVLRVSLNFWCCVLHYIKHDDLQVSQ